MLIKNVQQYAELLLDSEKAMITGKSGAGKSFSIQILDICGRKAADIDHYATQVAARSTHNLLDLVEWRALQSEDGKTIRCYCVYERTGVVIKLFLQDGKYNVGSLKFWDTRNMDLDRVISFWKTKIPIKWEKWLESLIDGSQLLRRTNFAQEFINPTWIADPGAFAKFDYIAGTCDNKDSVIGTFRPKALIYSRLEYSLQIRVWAMKAKNPNLPPVWQQWFKDMAGWSRSKTERAYDERVALMRALAIVYPMQVIPVTLADFGIPLKNAWSTKEEYQWIKNNLKLDAIKSRA